MGDMEKLRQEIEAIIRNRVATEIEREKELENGLLRKDMGRDANIISDSYYMLLMLDSKLRELGVQIKREVEENMDVIIMPGGQTVDAKVWGLVDKSVERMVGMGK